MNAMDMTQEFCLCNGTRCGGSEQCGRKAVADTTAELSDIDADAKTGVEIGVLLPCACNCPGRRKKRHATVPEEYRSTGNPRTYYTYYE